MSRMGTFGLAVACALTNACGGGGDGGAAAPGPAGVTLSGRVMPGTLQGAVVCLDGNDNLRCDDGEPAAASDAQGSYELALTAEQVQALAAARLVAVVPASAIDTSTAQPVGGEHVLLTRPYDAASTSYHFTPLRTRVEQIVWGGVAREQAEAVVRREAGLVDLGIDDDYVVAAGGLHADEAAWVREQAMAWFGQQTRAWMAMLHSPSADWFNEATGAGVFELSASKGSDGTVYTVLQSQLQAAPVAGDWIALNRSWSFDPVKDTAFQGYTLIETRGDFLDGELGWLDGDPQGSLAQRLDGGRVLRLRGGVAIAAEYRDVVDLAGVEMAREDIGGDADVVLSGSYPAGAKRFANHAVVQWRSGGYADAYEEGQPFGVTFANLDQFIEARRVQPDGSGAWRPLRGQEAGAVEMGFDAQGNVLFRDASTLAPLGSSPSTFSVFGGARLLVVPLSDAASLTEFGERGRFLYFCEHFGVHAVTLRESGGMVLGRDLRWLNGAAKNAALGSLGVPQVPR